MKQTAVEWLENKVWELDNEFFTVPSRLVEAIDQAKELEKQQQDEFAIEFTEWCDDNYFRMGNTNIWLQTIDFEIPIRFTTKELLEQFKNK